MSSGFGSPQGQAPLQDTAAGILAWLSLSPLHYQLGASLTFPWHLTVPRGGGGYHFFLRRLLAFDRFQAPRGGGGKTTHNLRRHKLADIIRLLWDLQSKHSDPVTKKGLQFFLIFFFMTKEGGLIESTKTQFIIWNLAWWSIDPSKILVYMQNICDKSICQWNFLWWKIINS